MSEFNPTKHEVQSGFDRIQFAERLVSQLPIGHDGANTWLMNYGTGERAIMQRKKWEEVSGKKFEPSAPADSQAVESSVSARTKENPHGIIRREPKENPMGQLLRDKAMGRIKRDPNDRVGETLDRLRRMETKITLIMEKLDLNTQAQKAEWSGGKVVVPSLDIKLRDILDVVPKTWGVESEIHVAHKGEQVISFFLPEED